MLLVAVFPLSSFIYNVLFAGTGLARGLIELKLSY